MDQYRLDLDKLRQEKEIDRNREQAKEYASDRYLRSYQEENHNTLVNNVPYNVQNPYILRSMGLSTDNPRNRSGSQIV